MDGVEARPADGRPPQAAGPAGLPCPPCQAHWHWHGQVPPRDRDGAARSSTFNPLATEQDGARPWARRVASTEPQAELTVTLGSESSWIVQRAAPSPGLVP